MENLHRQLELKINEGNEKSHISEFPVKSAASLDYQDFFNDHLLKNIPCLLKDVDLQVSPDFTNIMDFLETQLDPEIEVPVAQCSKRYFNSQEKCSMKLCDFIQYWKNRTSELFYLKDWHMSKVYPDKFYQTPFVFGSDWLNEYWEQLDDDYKFVYLGPAGSWTPFHSDVFGSFSWSANVFGLKKWIFFHQGSEPKNVYDIFETLPKSNYEDMKLRHHGDLTYFEVIQGPGEVIFVPSGWHHQVENLTDTLSINHNWLNAANVSFIWQNLKAELAKVKQQMSDCFIINDQEWKEMCQKLLLDSHGMNYSTFLDLLDIVCVRRLRNHGCFDNWTYGPCHIKYDLQQVQDVLKDVKLTACDDLTADDSAKAQAILANLIDRESK